MKVALVCPYDLAAAGGVQQLVLELGEHLVEAGLEVSVIGPLSAARSGVVPVGRVRVFEANASTVPVALDPRVPGRVRRAVAGHDLVHVHEPLIPLVGWAATRSGPPVVATFHADPPRWVRNLYRVAAPVGRRMLAGASLTSVSPVAAGALPWGPVTIVPNAVDVASYAVPVARRKGTVVVLGRDDPRKGLDVLLAAWPVVRRRSPQAVLTVMGAVRPEDLAGVRFLGRVDETTKRRELAAADVYVAPHRSGESFGIVVLEAMAAGCRIVASDLPAFRALAGDQADYVPPGDPAALAGAISAALELSSAGSAGTRDRAATYDWSRVVDRYLAVYRAAVKGDG